MKGKITFNGLQNPEYQELRLDLVKDVEFILGSINSDSGCLLDIVSGLRTTMSSIDIKCKKLCEDFEEQKKRD